MAENNAVERPAEAPEIVAPNPFEGMTIGRAALKLKANPELAKDFDAKFGDEETVSTLERARLHSTYSFYRGTIAGAASLTGMADRVRNPMKAPEATEPTDVEVANTRAAARIGKAQTGKEFKAMDPLQEQKNIEEKYYSVIDDLTKYEQMQSFQDSADFMAAVGGAIAGSILTPESAIGVGAQGATALGRIIKGGLWNAGAAAVTDPIVQALNIWGSGVQGQYDPVQGALAGPMGFVVGGGLVGAGEVVSKVALRNGIAKLAKDDPSLISAEIMPEPEARVTTREGAEIKTPEEAMPEAVPQEPKAQETPKPDTGEARPKAANDDVPKDETLAALMGEAEARPKADVKAEPKVDEPDVAARQPGGLRGEPKPEPSGVVTAEVKSLQKMVTELEDIVGHPIRQGRVGAAGALGTFNNQTGVIHVREFPDFSVSSHEVGHAIEKQLPEITQLINGRYIQELAPLDYDLTQMRPFEGFAEFVRLWFTNPAFAQRVAPGFMSEFNNLLERKAPEMLEKMVGLQAAYRNYLNAAPEQAVGATIVRSPKDTFGAKVMKKFTDAKVAPTVSNILSNVYDALINKNEDIYRATRAIADAIKEKNGGRMVDILPSQDPRVHFEMLQRSGQSAMTMIQNGVTPYRGTAPQGPSLVQAISAAIGEESITAKWDPKKVEQFDIYLKARMGIVRWDQFTRGEIPNPPFAESRRYFEEVIRKLEAENPNLPGASDMILEFQKNKRHRARDAGIYGYTPDSVANMDAMPFYVPMKRVRDDIKTGYGDGTGPTGGVKGFRGSMRDTISPLESIIKDTLAVERNIAHNDTVNAFRAFSKQAGVQGGKFVEDLPATEVKKIEFDLQKSIQRAMEDEGYNRADAKVLAEDFINTHFIDDPVTGTAFKTVTIDGKKEPIVFSAEGGVLKASRFMVKEEGFGLYELLTTMPKPAADISIQVLSAGSSALVTGVTTHPAYALRNLFRDQFAAWAFIPGYKPFWSAIKGLKSELTQGEFAKAYAQYGGVNPGASVAPLTHDTIQIDIDNIARKGYGIHKLTSLKGLSELVSVAESATRLGAVDAAFRENKRMGLSDYEAMISAVRAASDLLDFGRYGSHMHAVRAITPFMNAFIQSLDKADRTMRRPITRWLMGEQTFVKDAKELNTALTAWAKLGVTGFGMGVLWAAIFGEKDAYKDMGAQGKAANFVIPVGNDKVFLLPKPWELAMGFTAGEYAYASLMKDDPRAGQEFAKAAWESLKPPIPIWSNPMIKTTAETVMNYNTFSGGPIVPERLESLEKEYQYRANTSVIAKKLGKTFGMSPVKIDYMISGYLGYWGKDLTMMTNGNESNDPTQNLMDWALLRSGLKDPAMMSDARQKFWKHMGRTTGDFSQAVSTYNFLNSSPQREAEAQQYYSKLSNSRKAWVLLHSAGGEDGDAVFTADDRRTHPLKRSSDAVRVITKLKNGLDENTLTEQESKKAIQPTPDQRKKLSSILGQMALAEMVNGLISVKEPGYAGRPIFDMNVFMKQIKQISLDVGDELAAAYRTQKIYKADAVAAGYDELEKTLLMSGSKADIRLATAGVVSEGYQFDGVRQKKTPIRRTQIKGTKE